MPEKYLYKKLKNMNYKELDDFAMQIRERIFDVIYNNNGHLSSNLGVVELTLALYRIFDPFEDKIIWDTSHQSYVHKILTGRWQEFENIRKMGGISGFTNIFESESDAFGTGHAGTSISALLGYFIGDNLRGLKRNKIAIIGDGALTCGMALESLNQLKSLNSNVKIILNTNDMAISNSVGSLSTLFSKVRVKENYMKMKKRLKNTLNETDIGHDFETVLKKIKDGFKYSIYEEPVGFFEDMGIKYYGPVDGHNIKELEIFLNGIKNYNEGPILLHVLTTKGKGVELVENNPSKYHGVSKKAGEAISFSEIVGYTLKYLKNFDFIAFTAAMPDGTGLNILKKASPEKVFDLGITEPSIVTTAAAVSITGILPVVDIYSTFMQRSFDSIIHDVALQKLPVLFLLDRAGLVGEDGSTHHGVFDISYLRLIPDIEILAPQDGKDLANMIYTFILKGIEKPTFIRFPKETEKLDEGELISNFKIVDKKWNFLKKSKNKIYILAVGTMTKTVMKALEYEDVNIISVRSIKPLDNFVINELLENAEYILTYEEGSLNGGFNEEIHKRIKNAEIHSFGIEDNFITHGTREQLLEICELDCNSVKKHFEKIKNKIL
jgi:1-deoxy-D-xylulose-5-phosphate synthase